MIHLRNMSIEGPSDERFPFDVPALQGLEIELTRPVTFFVGENGSGKSTLLEGLACAAQMIGVGSYSLERDPTLDAVRPLSRALRLAWAKRTRRGFFMRAEDFFGFVNRVKREQVEARREAERAQRENADMAPADLARMVGAYGGAARELADRYGEDMDASSHGEQFLAFFRARVVPEGLYLLDEPEVALSPTSQLAFLSSLKRATEELGCQFIIATHSPMLMALPDAAIFTFDAQPVAPIAYEDVEHVRLVRDFLAAPERFLRHL
ncbi:MAG: AAA family ATPase [Gemmatimonadetes bacterium]|nr:AAA family ATPase [Gemmatimonadota bacterium]